MNTIRTVAAAALLALAGSLLAAPTASAEYSGHRWRDPDETICLSTYWVRNSAIKKDVRQSAYRWNKYTDLHVVASDHCNNAGHTEQRIQVVDRYYGDDAGWSGKTRYRGGFTWEDVGLHEDISPHGWTWVTEDPIRIYINRSKTNDYSGHFRQHIVSHEIGHALGLGHRSTCYSVMVDHWDCGYIYKYGGWRDWRGTWSNPGIDKIYWEG